MRQGNEVQFQLQALPVLRAQGGLQRQKNGDDIVADVEMVIKEMEKIYESYVDSEIIERHDYGDTRTADIFKQNASIIHDALELLKAQEPVSPMQTNGHTGSPIWICGNCKSWIGSKIVSYCWRCGRAVKWK